jgi:predicted membrane channel-forming protein YqfA (hemolysin III family)
MHIVALGWMFVVVLMSAAEATSPQGSLLGAVVTFVFYGLVPVGIVVYVMNTPHRRRARRRVEEEEARKAAEAVEEPTGPPP